MPAQPNLSPPTPPESQEQQDRRWREGLFWAILSPVFLGATPILAKLAYAVGADVLTVVALRTLIAAGVMWTAVLLFARHTIRTSKPGLLSSVLAGGVNGLGSILYYASLSRIDASVGQLINISYLIFVTILLRLIGQAVSGLTFFRTGLAILAIYLLTAGGLGAPDWLGAGMMFIAAFTYAFQLVLSQRIMYDIPAPTMTLYAVSAMAAVVALPWLLWPSAMGHIPMSGWQAIFWMGLLTAVSRLTLFLGVKKLGSMQTALLGVLEVVVSIVLAIFFLAERLTAVQWLGALVLLVSILLVRYERGVPKFVDWWQFIWRWRLPKG